MRRNKGLWILIALVAIAGGYALIDHRMDMNAKKAELEAAVIVPLKADQIQSVSIHNAQGDVVLERKPEGWALVRPLQDFAKPAAIDDFVEGLVTEKSTATAVEGESLDLKPFGLDHPKATIEVKDNLGKTIFIDVGQTKNFQGDSFLKVHGQNKVLIASSTWFAKAEKKLDDFQDKRFLRASVAKILKLQFQTPQERFLLLPQPSSVAGEPEQWISSSHPQWKLDQNKVREYMRQLNLNEGIEVVINTPPRSDEMKKWGLAKPRMILSADLKDSQSWSAHFGVGTDKIHRVHIANPEMTLKISPTESDRYARTTEDSFRDRNEPFRFDRTHVASVELVLGSQKKSFSGHDIESEKIQKLLQNLANLNLAQFTGRKAATFNKEILLKDPQGKILLQLQWGALKNVKLNGENASVFEARSSLYPDVITLLESDVNTLKLDELDSAQEKK